MRPTRGDREPELHAPPGVGGRPDRPEPPAPDGDPRLVPPELASRAREVLEHLRELERELSLHRTLEVERIEAAARTLHRLQTAIAVCGEQGHRSSALAELRSAQRSVVDALMLTLDLLDRLTYADLDR